MSGWGLRDRWDSEWDPEVIAIPFGKAGWEPYEELAALRVNSASRQLAIQADERSKEVRESVFEIENNVRQSIRNMTQRIASLEEKVNG